MKTAEAYAKALFELAREAGDEDRIAAEMEIISRCISENPDYLRLLDAAQINPPDRKKLIEEAIENAHLYIKNTVKLLAESREAYLFPRCAEEFKHMHMRFQGIAEARLFLPQRLCDEEMRNLQRRLEAKTGKKLRLKVEIDPSLIGGMRLETEGRTYDNSLRAKMAELQRAITGKTVEG